MLPAASHATSVGRLKLSPGTPAPPEAAVPAPRHRACSGRWRGPPSPAAAARSAAASASAGTRHRLRLAAQIICTRPFGIELDHLCRHLIDDPDVVLGIDAHLLRLQEPVHALADLADELAGPIELEQPRPAVRERRASADA